MKLVVYMIDRCTKTGENVKHLRSSTAEPMNITFVQSQMPFKCTYLIVKNIFLTCKHFATFCKINPKTCLLFHCIPFERGKNVIIQMFLCACVWVCVVLYKIQENSVNLQNDKMWCGLITLICHLYHLNNIILYYHVSTIYFVHCL